MKSETNVGDKIEQTEAGWEFDDNVAEQFDTHVEQSIPNYTTIQNQVAKIADWYLTESDTPTVYDLGCATGTTLQRILETRTNPNAVTTIGIDEARPMLDKAGEKLSQYANVRLLEQDLTVEPQFPNANLIVSLFTLSFLNEYDRQTLLSAAYRDLEPGGALVFVEKTYPSLSRFQSLFREHYFDYKRQYFEPDEIWGKASSLRGQLRPLTRGEYRSMLSDAGFDEVESWYQYYMWWGVIARKQ